MSDEVSNSVLIDDLTAEQVRFFQDNDGYIKHLVESALEHKDCTVRVIIEDKMISFIDVVYRID